MDPTSVRVETISPDEPVMAVIEAARETGRSRFPVIAEGGEEVEGIVHLKHAVGIEYDRRQEVRVREVMAEPVLVPSSVELDPLLTELRKVGLQIAVVVDEFGGTAGMLTMEDVVETIVGDIDDEHDLGEIVEEKLGEYEYLFSGGIDVERLVGEYNLDFPVDEDFGTLAGWILHHTEELPEPGKVLEIGAFRLTIAQVSHGRIGESGKW